MQVHIFAKRPEHPSKLNIVFQENIVQDTSLYLSVTEFAVREIGGKVERALISEGGKNDINISSRE